MTTSSDPTPDQIAVGVALTRQHHVTARRPRPPRPTAGPSVPPPPAQPSRATSPVALGALAVQVVAILLLAVHNHHSAKLETALGYATDDVEGHMFAAFGYQVAALVTGFLGVIGVVVLLVALFRSSRAAATTTAAYAQIPLGVGAVLVTTAGLGLSSTHGPAWWSLGTAVVVLAAAVATLVAQASRPTAPRGLTRDQ